MAQVQRAAAGALRTLAFKNEDNKNQIVECLALPTLIHMLRAEDSGIHYEAVGVIGNLVHSSQVRLLRFFLRFCFCYFGVSVAASHISQPGFKPTGGGRLM